MERSAVRRFIGKVGRDALDELFALREADNSAAVCRRAGGLDELRARIAAELASGPSSTGPRWRSTATT